MEFYSATKKNEILSFAGKWMELENINLSKVSQAQVKSHMLSLIYVLIQIQQYYERSHSGEVTFRRGSIKEETKKMNMGVTLFIQE
jgi:hypothetical protein